METQVQQSPWQHTHNHFIRNTCRFMQSTPQLVMWQQIKFMQTQVKNIIFVCGCEKLLNSWESLKPVWYKELDAGVPIKVDSE